MVSILLNNQSCVPLSMDFDSKKSEIELYGFISYSMCVYPIVFQKLGLIFYCLESFYHPHFRVLNTSINVLLKKFYYLGNKLGYIFSFYFALTYSM